MPKDLALLEKHLSTIELSSDEAALCPSLRDFYNDFSQFFPNLNGPEELSDDEIDEKAVDYGFSPDYLLVNCFFSQADKVVYKAKDIAEKYNLTVLYLDSFILEGYDMVCHRYTLCEYPGIKRIISSAIIPCLLTIASFLGLYFLLNHLIFPAFPSFMSSDFWSDWRDIVYYIVISICICVVIVAWFISSSIGGKIKEKEVFNKTR